jgi:hypothetical protein
LYGQNKGVKSSSCLVQDFVTYFHYNRYCKPLDMFVLTPPGIGYRVIRFGASRPRNPSSPTGIRSPQSSSTPSRSCRPHIPRERASALPPPPSDHRWSPPSICSLPLSLSLSLPRLSLSLSLPASTERSQIDRGVPSVISTTIAGVAPARPEQRSTPPQSPVAQVPRPRASKEQPRRGPTSRGARRRRPRCRGPDGTRRTAVWHARRCPAAPATPTRCSCSPGSVGCRHRQHLF